MRGRKTYYYDIDNEICRSFLESIGYGVLIHDSKTVLYATETANRIFGALEGQSIVGKKVHELIPKEYVRDYLNLVESILAGERPPLFQGLAKEVNGRRKWVEVCPNRVKYKGKKAVLVFLRDVTDEVEIKKKRSRIHELGLVQSVVSKVLEQDHSICAVERNVYEYCRDLDIADVMCFVHVSGEKYDIRYVPNISSGRYEECMLKNVGVLITMMLDVTRETYIPNIFDFNSYGYSSVGCKPRKVKEISFFGVPLKVWGKVEGVIGYMKHGFNTFSAEDVAIARILSGQISLSVSLQKALKQLAEDRERFYELATRDTLTGVYTRLFFNNWIEEHQEMLKRRKEVSTCVLMDIDNFKEINDTYGHLTGDEVLSEVANTIRNSVRGMDLVVRYGGDEFLVVFPMMKEEEAEKVMKRVVKNLSSLSRKFGFKIDVSYGIASANDRVSLGEALKKADMLMYEMKKRKKLLA